MLRGRRCPVLSVRFGWSVAPMWPQRSIQRPHPYHSCCRSPIQEWAQVTVTGVTVSDRRPPPEPAPYGTQMARRLSALPRGYRRNARNRKRLRRGGRRRSLSPQTLLPGDGYDAGVKKPVAVPKKWMVPPSGKVWVTSKLQVTRSPCTLPLDLVVVSLWVGSPGRVNWKVMSKACRTKTAVLPTTWPGVKSPLPLTVNWTVCPPQSAGNVRLFLAPLGSAAAPWARAASIRIPKVSATQRRLSMQASPSPDLVMSSPGSIWPDARQ